MSIQSISQPQTTLQVSFAELKAEAADVTRRLDVLAGWLAETEAAIATLKRLTSLLQCYRRHPETATPAGFVALLAMLADAGLLSWADNGGGDTTGKRAVTLDDLAVVMGVQRES